MSDDAIQIRGLSHSFRGHKAVRDVSFAVGAGQIHGFVGPNGAGKTTTLKVIATLLTPQRGQVRILGQDLPGGVERVRQRIGFMPDHFSMYRQMRVEEYLDFFAAAYGLPRERRDQVLGDVLTLTDMAGRRKDLIRGLSRGMQQRVCLARVLVHDPALLLLDEPASGLDPRARIELMAILRELRGMGKTIFISSHILGELADLCDHVTILDRGQVKYTGTMQGLLSGATRGERVWRLELAASVAGLADTLRNLPGMVTVDESAEAGEAGGGSPRVVLRLRATEGSDGNALLAAVLAAGAQVRSFGDDTKRLDQAFLELTTAGVREQ